jgi:hypothetical protein
MPGHGGDGDGRFRAAVGALGRGGDIHQFHVRGEPLDVLGAPSRSSVSPTRTTRSSSWPADILVLAVHGQRVDAVAAAQAQVAEAPAHHARARRDQHLDRRGAHLAELVDGLELLRLLQAQDLGHVGPEDHAVALFQLNPDMSRRSEASPLSTSIRRTPSRLNSSTSLTLRPIRVEPSGTATSVKNFARARDPPPSAAAIDCVRAGGGGR